MVRAPLLLATCIAGLVATPSAAETLQEALASAYRSNPTLQAARASQRATDESVPIQRAAGLPSLSATGQYTEFVKQSSSNFLSPERSMNAGIDLAIPIYSGGAVRNGVRAAENRVEAGRADLRGTESAIFSQVVGAYMDVIQNEAIVELSANNVEVLSVNLQATTDRFEIGELTRTDVAQSESRLAIARSELRSAQSNLLSARERYVQLVGNAPTDLQPPPPLPGLPGEVEVAVATALDNNPDLLAASQRVEAANYEIRVAGAGRLPQLSIFTGSTYQNYLGSLSSIPGTESAAQASTAVQGGLRASIPLFQGGRVAAQERQAQAQAQTSMEQLVASEREVIAQVRSAFSSWQASNAIIASSQTAVDAAELSLEGVRAENTVGNRTILDVLNAQQELLRAQVQLITARRNAYVAGFTLLAAMGRAEANDLGLENGVPLYDPAENYERVRGKIWDWSQDPDPMTQSTRTINVPPQNGDIPVALQAP